MLNLITTLSRSAAIRRAIQILRLHRLGNFWLRRFPVVKRLPGSEIVYRATRLESIPLANEMFEKGNLYDATLLPENFTNYADLGCNVGYFTVWLAHLARGRKLSGLMLDANPDAVREAQWHAQANNMPEVFAINGIVGEGQPGEFPEFFLYESNICSTSQLTEEMQRNLKGRWTTVSVPCIQVAAQWQKHFGTARCHLLKIDIEGSEMHFLRRESTFLAQVDTILIEWHTWGTTLDEIKRFLAAEHFSYIKTIEESATMGTAFFRRNSG